VFTEEEDGAVPAELLGEVQEAVKRSLPNGIRQRDGMEFRLAQAVKGIKLDWTGAQLRTIFDLWYEDAKQFMRRSEDYCWVEFRRAFDNCRSPGKMTVQQAIEMSANEPIPAKAKCHTEGIQRLVRVCSYFQRCAGLNRPFPMSCRWAAEIVGCKSTRTGSKALALLEKDGILKLAQQGSQETREASEFFYLPLAKLDPAEV
jgi:hypothetical protein